MQVNMTSVKITFSATTEQANRHGMRQIINTQEMLKEPLEGALSIMDKNDKIPCLKKN